MTTATRDPDAAARLWGEVQRICHDRGIDHPKSWLHIEAQVSRPALDNWFEDGVMPPADGMVRIATALGVESSRLWLRWLDVPLPDNALVRIAEALERAYPPTPVEGTAAPLRHPARPGEADETQAELERRAAANQSERRRSDRRQSGAG